MVMDARNGKVLYSRNADSRLHPASLTKMMTLYVAIEAVENGEISLDKKVKISKFAASEPPSKLGLRPGSRIALRYLMRAAAVRSANDAATAIAEAIEGSEKAFVARMNRTARAMGLTKTNFKNAHGLTQKGHLSSARDMTILGRHVIYDYPEYYNLFSRRSAHAGIKTVRNTNTKFLANYSGSDGIKTGYTSAAGFNLVASAKRGNKRIITTVFGGRSTATRNKHVAELMDIGFRRAVRSAKLVKPRMPPYQFGRKVVFNTTISNLVPAKRRPTVAEGDTDDGTAAIILLSILAEEGQSPAEPEVLENQLLMDQPKRRPKEYAFEHFGVTETTMAGIRLTTFLSRTSAEKHLVKAALVDFSSLVDAKRRVEKRGNGFVATFLNLSEDDAKKACARLEARKIDCLVVYLY